MNVIESRLTFSVEGKPVTQGSKRAWHNAKTDRTHMLDSNYENLRCWRAIVADEARRVRNAVMGDSDLYIGPIGIICEFTFERPRGHYGTGRNANVIKMSAPEYPISKANGDLDKLLRAICDALSGVLYRDDSQIVATECRKYYGLKPGAKITVDAL